MSPFKSSFRKMSLMRSSTRLAPGEALKQLRDRLTTRDVLLDEYKLKSDNFLLRYLKAHRYNVDKAEKMIDAYVEALDEHQFGKLENETFPQKFSDKFTTLFGGWDNDGRPIAMVPSGGLWNLKEAINNGNEEMFIRYIFKVTSTFERLILETDSDYGILVCDVANVAYGNYFHKRTLEVLLFLVRLVEKIAPGLFGKVYLVNSSKLCVTLFNTVKRMVTLSTDICILDSNEEKWKATLRQFIPEEGICPHFGGVLKKVVQV